MEDMGPYSTRFLCDILKDMRAAYDTRNFSYLPGLIEELQYRAYRMEERIDTISNVESMERRRLKLKKEIAELRKEKKELQEETGKETEDHWYDE